MRAEPSLRSETQPGSGSREGEHIQSETWRPSRFVRYLSCVGTSTGPAEIETDAGRAYLKALGNREGPHVLAAEWIGTALADWLGLRTFSVAKLVVAEDDKIPLGHDRRAQPGTAIALRAERGASWQGSDAELDAADNVRDVGRLVVLDTWLRNCDRSPPEGMGRKPNYDNVFLSEEGAQSGRFTLTAFDHTHCFVCGRELTAKISQIDNVKDPRIYGRFPVFDRFLERDVVDDAVRRLSEVSRSSMGDIVEQIADDWDVSPDAKLALVDFLVDRAGFLCSSVTLNLYP